MGANGGRLPQNTASQTAKNGGQSAVGSFNKDKMYSDRILE